MSQLVGHTHQRRVLSELLRRGKLPATILLAGSQGIGKRLVAVELAEAILCEQPSATLGGCGACEACRLSRSHGHPDVHVINCAERDEVKAERIRELLSTMQLRSFSGRSRVAILDNAELLPTVGANALLKELEEPRPNTYYLLVCANIGKLPPTLRSRCQVYFFDLLKETEVETIIARSSQFSQLSSGSKSEVAKLARLADGALQELSALAAHGERWSSFRQALEEIADGAHDQAVSLAQLLAKEKDELRTNLQLLRIIAREHLAIKSPQISHGLRKKWSELVLNLLAVESLLFERHLSPLPLLTAMLIAFAEDTDFTLATSDDRLISSFIV